MKRQTTPQLTPRSLVEHKQPKDKDKVKVMLRIRPFQAAQDEQQFLLVQDENTVLVNKPGYPSYMKFNYVQSENINKLSKQSSQQNIFDSVKQAVQCIFDGIDSTIFAYGQTGAGKTYTIVGNCPQLNSDTENYKVSLLTNERGILPRALQRIFQEQAAKRDSRITISFFEIYNEKIFDLLNSGAIKPLQIRESKGGELSIPGLSFVQVVSTKEVINYLAQGIKNRATSSTHGNIKSSRSHSIFHVKYQRLVMNQQTGQHEVLVANLRIVDLAGSEKFNVPQDAPQAEKQIRLLQLKSINGSLSKLGHCISALTSNARSHIPVRDSKLTRILSDSLLGPGKIRLIICVSPSTSAMNETSSTLQFADRVKKAVFQRPTMSVQKKKMVDFDEFKQLQKQLQAQRSKRMELQNMLKQFLKGKNFQQEDLLKENFKLRHEVALLKQQIKIYSSNTKLTSQQQHQRSQLPLTISTKDINNKTLNLTSMNNKSKSPLNKTNKNALNQKQSNLSPSRLKSSQLKTNQNTTSALKMVNRSGLKITTQQFIKTPPKTSATKSVHDYESQQRRSYDGSMSPFHYQHNMSRDFGRGFSGKRADQFDKNIKKFMAHNDNDRELQQKVRKRLHQIKKQLIQNQISKNDDCGFLISDVEKLWKK